MSGHLSAAVSCLCRDWGLRLQPPQVWCSTSGVSVGRSRPMTRWSSNSLTWNNNVKLWQEYIVIIIPTRRDKRRGLQGQKRINKGYEHYSSCFKQLLILHASVSYEEFADSTIRCLQLPLALNTGGIPNWLELSRCTPVRVSASDAVSDWLATRDRAESRCDDLTLSLWCEECNVCDCLQSKTYCNMKENQIQLSFVPHGD